MLALLQRDVCCAQCSSMCKPRTLDLEIGDANCLAKDDATAKTLPSVCAKTVTPPTDVSGNASTRSTLGRAEDASLATKLAELN